MNMRKCNATTASLGTGPANFGGILRQGVFDMVERQFATFSMRFASRPFRFSSASISAILVANLRFCDSCNEFESHFNPPETASPKQDLFHFFRFEH